MKRQSEKTDKYFEEVRIPIRRTMHYETVKIPIRVCVKNGKIPNKERLWGFDAIRRPLVKFSALMLIIALNWLGPLAIGLTLGNFNDIETSSPNRIGSASLNFSLNAGDWSNEKISASSFVSRTIDVIKNGSLDFQYNASSATTSGDNDFCNALQLEAKLDGLTKYNGALIGLNFSPPIFIGGDGIDNWEFIVSLPESPLFDHQTCQFKFIFIGWQENFVVIGGYNNEENLDNSLTDPIMEEEIETELTLDSEEEEISTTTEETGTLAEDTSVGEETTEEISGSSGSSGAPSVVPVAPEEPAEEEIIPAEETAGTPTEETTETNEENQPEENSTTEPTETTEEVTEETTTEETTTEETAGDTSLINEQAPVVEEQPAALPEDNSVGNSGGSGSEGSSDSGEVAGDSQPSASDDSGQI